MRAESLKGHLDGMILAVVADEPAHGYAVIETLKRRSSGVFDLPEGTVYPALHRLESDGLLSSGWVDAEGRRRRVYRLTRRGRAALVERRDEWQRFSRAVRGVLA
jgi:DNA-binding PadR family transcriptional regulator